MTPLILLVWRDPHGRAALRAALEAAGMRVGEAADARVALRTIARVAPHAVIADLDHAAVDAGAAAELALAATPAPLVYLLATSADVFGLEHALRGGGVAGVFLKPPDAKVIVALLESALGVHGAPAA